LKRLVLLPYWNPPPWANASKNSTKPGPYNAFGLYMSELCRTNDPQFFDDRDGIRIHSTAQINNFLNKSSHGCIRLHPQFANRFFNFLLRFTPHSDKTYIPSRGDVTSFNPEYYIKLEIK